MNAINQQSSLRIPFVIVTMIGREEKERERERERERESERVFK